MREFQEKKRIKRILYSKWNIFLLSFILIFAFYSTAKVYLKGRGVFSSAKETKKLLAEIEKEKIALETKIARLESEFGKEEEIRKRFNVARPGEKILVIVDKNEKNINIDGESGGNLFLKIWRSVKKIF